MEAQFVISSVWICCIFMSFEVLLKKLAVENIHVTRYMLYSNPSINVAGRTTI